jgi:hypothetical protein
MNRQMINEIQTETFSGLILMQIILYGGLVSLGFTSWISLGIFGILWLTFIFGISVVIQFFTSCFPLPNGMMQQDHFMSVVLPFFIHVWNRWLQTTQLEINQLLIHGYYMVLVHFFVLTFMQTILQFRNVFLF